MDNKRNIKIILLLSITTVLLLGGIWINQFISLYVSASSSHSSFIPLPSIKNERYIGKENSNFVNAFFINNDTYIFYNNENAIMEKSGDEYLKTDFEGKIISVVSCPSFFVIAIKNENSISIQRVGYNGIPTHCYTVLLKDANIQFLGYDGDICFAVQHKGDVDYVLTYYKIDEDLNEVYRRDIYSLYNLSTVSVFPLSNKTIIFFSACYGSVKRGGYAILDNISLSTNVEYYSCVNDYEVTDAKPYKDGFIVAVKEKDLPKTIILDNNFSEKVISLSDKKCEDIKLYTNGNSCCIGVQNEKTVDLYNIDNEISVINNFANSIYDCMFIDNTGVFAINKEDATYIYNSSLGSLTPILDSAPLYLSLKYNKRLCFFASLPSSIYYASLL